MIRIVLVALIGAAVIGLSLVSAVLLCEGRRFEPAPSDAIIVLGARVWPDGQLSNSLEYRCQSALEAWQAGIAPVIITCGGRGGTEPISEAEAMRDWFVERGVPASAIRMDETSADTAENLRNAREIMRAEGMQTAAVCTSSYHLTRALWLARDMGIEATGISAPSPTKPTTWVHQHVREACSWLRYFARKAFKLEET